MSKSLVLIKEKYYDNFENPEYIYKARVIESSIDVMESLPLFVQLNLNCNNKDCDNLVDASITIKTSRKIYKILREITLNANTVGIELYCPICSNDMEISEIEIVGEDTNG